MKKKREKKKEQADLTQLSGVEEDEWQWGGVRGSATYGERRSLPALSFW